MATIETALAVTLLPHFIADTSWVSGLMPPVAGEDGQDDGDDRNGTCSDFASPLHSRYLLVAQYEFSTEEHYVSWRFCQGNHKIERSPQRSRACLLYTSDAAD